MSQIINQIVNGNSLKEIKKIPDKSFDLVFADPPYNMQIGETLTRPDASKVNGVKFVEADFIIDFPVSVFPVKKIWSKF